MKVRLSEQQSVSSKRGKPLKRALNILVRDLMLIWDYRMGWEDFKIFGNKSNKFILELKESYYIKKINQPSIRTNFPRTAFISVCHFE